MHSEVLDLKSMKEAVTVARKGLGKVGDDVYTKTNLLLILGNSLEDKEEKIKVLDEAIQLQGHLTSSAMALVAKLMM